ncbi:MAG: DNA primase [Candidatus Methylumidiphilus sp.]
MAGKIPREFIDELIARVDLVDLIHDRVPLKKTGANYSALCPFHSEKSPSFSVNRDKQFYHCFGCGASGNAISFLMDYERQSFVEAVETLAETLGLPIPREAYQSERREQETSILPLYEVQAQAAEFYASQLRQHPEAERARDYLAGRGLSAEIIERFQLGYALPGWRNLPESLGGERLLASGLAIANDGGGFYDRFRDRVMFPIRDRRGRVIGFGGRVMGDEKPKYLNSPETPTFKKSREVYGLHELLSLRQKPERIVVVEGYMDVIALAQNAIPYAVATLGTATSADHAGLLFRYAKELVFCFDGDAAGRNAAWKALEASLPALREGRAIRFLMLPQGHDPDSLVREEGPDHFEFRLEAAQPLSDYLFQHLSENLDLATIEGRSALFQSANPLIGKLPPGVFREMMQEQLKKLAGHSKAAPRSADRPRPAQRAAGRVRPSLLRFILALLIQNPGLYREVDGDVRRALEQDAKAGPLARKLFALFDGKPDISLGGILERFRDEEEGAAVLALSAWESLLSLEGAAAEFQDALKQFLNQSRQQRLEVLLEKAARSSLDQDERDEMRRLLSTK